MRYGSWLWLAVAFVSVDAAAQPISFLTEQQKLASYCAGVSEARTGELNQFIKMQCAGSSRKECVSAGDELAKAQVMDRRLWAFLTDQLFSKTERDVSKRQKTLSQQETERGSTDWRACKIRPRGQDSEDFQPCRESRGCLIDARFSFLPP